MTDDEWQAHVTHEAAKAIGEWLEGRGRLHQPIRSLTMPELEAMAQNAISRFIVLASQRIAEAPTSPGRRSSRCCSWAESLRPLQPGSSRLLLHASAAAGPISDLRLLLAAAASTRGRRHRQEEQRHDRQDRDGDAGDQGRAAQFLPRC